MSELSRPAVLDRGHGVIQADLEHGPVAGVDPKQSDGHLHVPAPPPPNGIRQEILERLDMLDIQERQIIRERLDLKSRWNHSLMVTRLPNEILITIFVYSSALLPSAVDDNDGDYFKFAPGQKEWTKLMLVCRRWSDVARATPALWRTIDVGKKTAWMKLTLVRSSDATVDVSFSSDLGEEHAALLQPHCHRLRSLRLRRLSPAALPVIRASLPALESLEILNGPKDKFLPERICAINDLGITRERFPNLRTLQVSYTTIPTDPLFYARLRKLSLKGCPFKSSLEQFIQLLADCPHLRHVELADFLQQLDSAENVGTPRPLPSLRSLRLDNHIPMHSTRFLSRIVIPTALLSIAAKINTSYGGDEEDDDTFCALIPRNLWSSLPQLSTVRWARLTVVDEKCIVECHPSIPEPGGTTLVKLTRTEQDWDGGLWECMDDFLALFGSVPLTHLETLGYSDSTAGPLESWTRVFRTFSSLVSLEADIVDPVLEALFEASLTSPLDGPVVCGGLEHMTLNGEWWSPEKVDIAFDSLIRCLLYRAGRGSRLKELHLELRQKTQVTVREKYLPQLEDIVPDIVFGDAFE